jgi:hypothetical protein
MRTAGRGLPAASSIATPCDAPVAQLDRVSASEAEGRGFESRRAHHSLQIGGYRSTRLLGRHRRSRPRGIAQAVTRVRQGDRK